MVTLKSGLIVIGCIYVFGTLAFAVFLAVGYWDRTNNLVRRVYEHREGQADGFTKKYGIKALVYFEPRDDVARAIQREKNIKRWRRAWKIDLIEKANPTWRDLYNTITL